MQTKGADVGTLGVGEGVSPVGRAEGDGEGLILDVGSPVGLILGSELGFRVGRSEGKPLGSKDGSSLGVLEGLSDGISLGEIDGLTEGISLGAVDGSSLGTVVGDMEEDGPDVVPVCNFLLAVKTCSS